MTDVTSFDRTRIPKRPASGSSPSIRCMRDAGAERAHYLLERLIDHARRSGAYLPFSANTAYVNTIPVAQEPEYPGDRALERRLEAYIRWNAVAMVAASASRRIRRPHRQLRLVGDAVRGRLQPLLARAHGSIRRLGVRAGHSSPGILRCEGGGLQPFLARADRQASRRHGVHAGPFFARHLCARLPRRPPQRRAAQAFPPGSGRRRASVPIRIRG